MFSQVSVCPQGGVCPIACWDTHPLGQVYPPAGTPPGRFTPRQVHLQAGTPPGRYTPGRYPPGQVHPPVRYNTPCPVHAGIRSTSGRYASHWNAFLFLITFYFCSLVSDMETKLLVALFSMCTLFVGTYYYYSKHTDVFENFLLKVCVVTIRLKMI